MAFTRSALAVGCVLFNACAAEWVLTFNLSSGLIESFTDGHYELADSSSGNLPTFYTPEGQGNTTVTSCSQVDVSTWNCAGRASLASFDSCGGAAQLAFTYNLTLSVLSSNPQWTALHQSIALRPAQAGCTPLSFLGVVLPRPLTLASTCAGSTQAPGAARASGWQRHMTSHYRSGEAFDFAVATSGDYNGVTFVSAGEAWMAPGKQNPAFPGFELSVPVVDEYCSPSPGQGPPPAVLLSLLSDPLFFTNFDTGYAPGQTHWAWAYNCSHPDIGCFQDRPVEQREFWTVVATDGDTSLEARMEKLHATALAWQLPTPSWVHTIALTSYDYFTPLPPSPNGWDADVDALAAAVPLANRSTVVLCIHGWYGTLGQYTLIEPNGTALQDSWIVFPSGAQYTNGRTGLPMGPIPVTKDIIHARINKAKAAGFRVVMYFADGMNTCEGMSFFSQQAILSTYHGYIWVGPDSSGPMHILNPLHSSTTTQYKNYLAGLLDEYGSSIDGFVWDETFELSHNTPGQHGQASGYAARAWLELVQQLTAQVHAHPACAGRCVFTVAPCLAEMPTALFSDGTYEDTGLNPAAAPVGVLPNWKKALWECGWDSISKGYVQGNVTEVPLVEYNIPAGIGNGWGDFIGFGNMTEEQQQWFVGLMERHDPSRGAGFPNATAYS